MLSALKGGVIIAQTPFDDRGAVDPGSIATLVDFYLGHGADGFVVLGVSGEGPRLAPDGALGVASRFIARAGAKPVIVGVSNPSSAQPQMMAKQAMDRGTSGVMIAPPGGPRTEEELFGYFGAIFDMIGDVPTVLQDFLHSTGVWMSGQHRRSHRPPPRREGPPRGRRLRPRRREARCRRAGHERRRRHRPSRRRP